MHLRPGSKRLLRQGLSTIISMTISATILVGRSMIPEEAKLTLNFPGEFDQIVPELRNSLPALLYVERLGEPTDRHEGICSLD